jgi:hypothetical protein
MFLEGSKHQGQETYRILGALCLSLESLPMGRISPDSFQDGGNASPRDHHECLSKNSSGFHSTYRASTFREQAIYYLKLATY